jgi:hypothetical protein
MSLSGSWDLSSMLWELLMSLPLSGTGPRDCRRDGSSLSLLDRRGFVRGEPAAEVAARVEVRGGYMARRRGNE